MSTRKISFLTVLFLLIAFLWVDLGGAQETKVPFTAETPVVLTNPGQAPEYSIPYLLAQRINLPITMNLNLEGKELNGFKTLIMIIGGSGKGLGAAGTNMQSEAERAKQLIATAKEKESKSLVCI